MKMTMRKMAAKLLEQGKVMLADAALDIDSYGVKFENLYEYAAEIGVDDAPSMFDEYEVLDAIVALEQQCQFS